MNQLRKDLKAVFDDNTKQADMMTKVRVDFAAETTANDKPEKDLVAKKDKRKKPFEESYQTQLYLLFLCYPYTNFSLFVDTVRADAML